MFNLILYILSAGLLLISFFKDRQRTKAAIKKAWKSLENILPQMLAILLLIGMMLALLSPEVIYKYIGSNSGWLGTVIASLIGSITLIPGFVAFPLASALLKSGAGITQISIFISTLMMVGIVTLPVEIKYFGKKAAVIRNVFAYLFSFVVALIIGGILG
jgi:uncharacterized membrane protein YraQ (UPF0718 family)